MAAVVVAWAGVVVAAAAVVAVVAMVAAVVMVVARRRKCAQNERNGEPVNNHRYFSSNRSSRFRSSESGQGSRARPSARVLLPARDLQSLFHLANFYSSHQHDKMASSLSAAMSRRRAGRRSRIDATTVSGAASDVPEDDRPLLPLPRAVRAWFLGHRRADAKEGVLVEALSKGGEVGAEREEEDDEHAEDNDDDDDDDDDEHGNGNDHADDAEDAFENTRDQAAATLPWLRAALLAGLGTRHGSEHDDQVSLEARRLLGAVPSFAKALDDFSLFPGLRVYCKEAIAKLSASLQARRPKIRARTASGEGRVRQDNALVGLPLPPHSEEWGDDASDASEFTQE